MRPPIPSSAARIATASADPPRPAVAAAPITAPACWPVSARLLLRLAQALADRSAQRRRGRLTDIRRLPRHVRRDIGLEP